MPELLDPRLVSDVVHGDCVGVLEERVAQLGFFAERVAAS